MCSRVLQRHTTSMFASHTEQSLVTRGPICQEGMKAEAVSPQEGSGFEPWFAGGLFCVLSPIVQRHAG